MILKSQTRLFLCKISALAASTQAGRMWREKVLIIDFESWRSCPGCFRGIRKLLWGWEGSCKARLWLWGKWSPRETSLPSHTASFLSVGSGRPLSSLQSLCMIVSAYIEFRFSSGFLFLFLYFSFFFFFPAGFWCQGIYRFSLYGSHTTYIPSQTT